MNMLDPQGAMKSLEDGTIAAVKNTFPLVGRKQTLVATNVYSGNDVDIDDVQSQKRARIRGRTWATGLYGDFNLVDNETGKVIDSAKNVRLVSLPKMTRRYSFIVGGTEYQADRQWRLKSGVYSRQKANGELEAHFNLEQGRGFRMGFYPEKRQFLLQYGSTNVQLLPVLRALGADDADIRHAWGGPVFDTVAGARDRGDLQKLAKVLDPKYAGTTNAAATDTIRAQFAKTALRSDTTKITLGKPYDKVDAASLTAASSKLLNISRGTEDVDPRDSLKFKELWSVEDHVPERIENSRRRIQFKLRNNVDRKDKVRDIVTNDVFNVPVQAFFTSTSLAQRSSQVNPIDMVGGALRTTIMGQGAIGSDKAISMEAKSIDPSNLGFIDSVHTPEGSSAGIVTHLALGVGRRGLEPTTKVYNTKTRQIEDRTPAELADKNVGFSDQFDWTGKHPVALGESVTASPAGGGDPTLMQPGEVDYILQNPKGMFSMTANLVPFLSSTQANRAGMATRHMEQAISIKNREAPLVQVASGQTDAQHDTWEKVMGEFSSHKSPVTGKILSVDNDKIVVLGADKQKHIVQLYDNFPLNDKKAFLHSEPLVKVGDEVTANQIIADTNYTRNGALAMGVNLRVGYLNYRGGTFEDSIIVSESTAKKMTSEHMYKERVYLDRGMGVGLNKFRANYPGLITEDNAKKLDEDGVIKAGQIVNPGDVIIAVLKKAEPTPEQVMLRGIHKSLARPYRNNSVVWESQYPGVVTDVTRNGNEIVANVRTEEPLETADKMSGRYGNKGIVGAVLPDEEMPKDAEGNPLEIIVSPSGVPGRTNPSQVLETVLAKVADKTGQPYAVDNFQTDSKKKIVHVKGFYRTIKTEGGGTKEVYVHPYDREAGYQELVTHELAKHGMSSTEELFDPATGKSFGQVLVGKQYFFKLMHQVDKKLAARGQGYGNPYDANMVPKGEGAQRFGELGMYAMLAHGSTDALRDAMTYSSDKQQNDVWTAIQTGEPIPAPQSPFAYDKFLAYLNSVGVNVEKSGDEMKLVPFTDEDILSKSRGELKDASKVLRGKDLKPEPGGLFDEKITGGPGGKYFAHIKLTERMPNPVFERATLSLLGLTGAQYDAVIAGTQSLNGKTGPSAIADALSRLNIDKELADAQEGIKAARAGALDKANRKLKYLRTLKALGLRADQAYTLQNVPVIPPVFRPITAMEGGDLNVDGINLLYRDVAMLNDKLKEGTGVLPEAALAPVRKSLYDSVVALSGIDSVNTMTTIDGEVKPSGVLTVLSGRTTPKEGFVHEKLMDRRQDLTMRSTISPDHSLSLDELSLPRRGAMVIFKPFVVKELVQQGFTPLQARDEVEKDTSLANKALDVVVSKRPVIFKRDPVLHKFGMLGLKVRLNDRKDIGIHPLHTGGFGADFDGDAMSVFVPVSNAAIEDTYNMMPSRNLFNAATGKAMYQPSLEGQLGLFMLTQFGTPTNKSYATRDAAVAAQKNGDIKMTDVITAERKRTTVGRIMFNAALPSGVQNDAFLTDPALAMDSNNLQKVLKEAAFDSPKDYAVSVDKLKNLGFGYSHDIGFSFELNDFTALRDIRESVLKGAHKQAAAVQKLDIPRSEKDKRTVAIYTAATAEMSKQAAAVLDKNGNKMRIMNRAGVKPGWGAIQQILLAPMLLENSQGRVIPTPVTKSYAEGVDSAGYWVASQGARKGLVDKVLAVQKPGVLNKQLVNATIGYTVAEDDCNTSRGITLDINDKDVVGRYLAKDVVLGGASYRAGTSITQNIADRMKQLKVGKLLVRSALKCQAHQGLCAKCVGLADDGKDYPLGTNIGVISAQAIGERGTQLSMKVFHTGGLAGGGGGGVTGGIDRVNELLKMPEVLPGKATLAQVSGKIDKITKSPVGGFDVVIGGEQHYVPHSSALLVKPGESLEKGDKISSGSVDPRELLDLTNMDTVQRYMSDELHNAYASEGVKRRNGEVVVKALTNLAKVVDPGDSDEFIRGDYIPLSRAQQLNKEQYAANPIQYEPVLRGLDTVPLDSTTDWMARLQYRRLKETFTRGAQEGWKSNIHGASPIPGLIYSKEFGKPAEGSRTPY